MDTGTTQPIEAVASVVPNVVKNVLQYLKNYGCTCQAARVMYEREITVRRCSRDSPVKYSMFLNAGKLREREDNRGIVLVSYPRSGNSYLRQLLELRSNIYTGSDNIPNRKLALDLLTSGYYGEGVANDSSVWITKSHYPERQGYIPIHAKVVVLVVRNPFDAIASYFQMGMTNSHNRTLTPEAMRLLTDVYDDFIKSEIKTWNNFHYYWLQRRQTAVYNDSDRDSGNHRAVPVVPVYVVRYEDLAERQEETMNGLLSFLAPYYPARRNPHCSPVSPNVDDTDDTVAAAVFAPRECDPLAVYPPITSAPAGYAPRQGGIGRSLRTMSQTQIRTITSECSCLLQLFGYSVHGSKSFSVTGNMSSKSTTKAKNIDTAAENESTVPPQSNSSGGKGQKNQKGKMGKKMRGKQEEAEAAEEAAAAALAAAKDKAKSKGKDACAKSKGGKGKKGRRGEESEDEEELSATISAVKGKGVKGKGAKGRVEVKSETSSVPVSVPAPVPVPAAASVPVSTVTTTLAQPGLSYTVASNDSDFILSNNNTLVRLQQMESTSLLSCSQYDSSDCGSGSGSGSGSSSNSNSSSSSNNNPSGRYRIPTSGLVINAANVSAEECAREQERGYAEADTATATSSGSSGRSSLCPPAVLYHTQRTLLIRDENLNNRGCDLYGRNIFNIRHMYTNNDKDPLPCISR